MNISSDGYYKNNHSCFLLQYHLVLVTKYRHPVITGERERFLKMYTEDYFRDRDLHILSMECMPDHMHILFEAVPNMNLSEFINAFKSASSRKVRQYYERSLRAYYWKPYFWSKSYFLGTVSERTTEVVRQYIQNQKKG